MMGGEGLHRIWPAREYRVSRRYVLPLAITNGETDYCAAWQILEATQTGGSSDARAHGA